jgi:hypothetical protein
MASGRDGAIPYRAIGSDWKDFMDESDFPEDISFQDPCRYLTDSSNQILKLWRLRQEKGEIPFKFTFVIGRNKEPDVTQYPDGTFNGLQPAGLVGATTVHESPQESSPEESEEEEEEDNEPRMRKNKAAWSDDEEEEGERDGGGIPNITAPQDDDEQGGETPHRVKKPGRPRRVISSEDETLRVIPRGRPWANSTSNFNSSPTLAGSSPIGQDKTNDQPVRGRSKRRVALPTPEQSQIHTPTPEPRRELRSRTKPAEIRREPEANPTAGNRVRTRSKGKMKDKK